MWVSWGNPAPNPGWADKKTNQKTEFGLTDKAKSELKTKDLRDIFFRLSPLFFFFFYFFGRSRKLRDNPACKGWKRGWNERTNHEPEAETRATNPWLEDDVGWDCGQIDT